MSPGPSLEKEAKEVPSSSAAVIMESTPAVARGSSQIWSICLSHAHKFDNALVETWKSDMDGILIFSGLFSAVVTAFLIATYPALQPDVPTINANLTAQVATMLSRSTNQSEPVIPQLPPPNSHGCYLVINGFWFLSLSYSVICALVAILVQQWSRAYLQGTEECSNMHERIRMRTFLHRGVQKFFFSELVNSVPIFLHVSIFFFSLGINIFLYTINTALGCVILFLYLALGLHYSLFTFLPVFFYDCPYKTPLTYALSYITYMVATCRPRRRQHLLKISLDRWDPTKQATRLTTMWKKDGNKQGTELDYAALRWTLLTLTDPDDLEMFFKALHALLQSDSNYGITYDGRRIEQALLFGPDMLVMKVVQLLHYANPLDIALAPADRLRLETDAVTCLSIVSLLSRSCDGPTQSEDHLWRAWAASYSSQVIRDALTLCKHPALATLAHSTAFLLLWRALVTYRTFLADIYQHAKEAENAAPAEQDQLTSEIRDKLPSGVYFMQTIYNALHGLVRDPALVIRVGGGVTLAQRTGELAVGALNTHISGANSHASVLATAAQEDMEKAKTCIAVLFISAARTLPVDDAVGQEALRALAAPLRWSEPYDYDEDKKAMELLIKEHHAHGEEASTGLDADQVVALYRSIHDTQQWRPRVDPSGPVR